MNYVQGLMQATVFALAVASAGYSTSTLAADRDDDDVAWFGINAKPYGVSYSEWSARWWQHMVSTPSGDNSLIDAGGNKCSTGQSGPVWLLAGNLGGVSQRNCDVPAGTALYFPIYNFIGANTPNVCFQDANDLSVADLRAQGKGFVDAVTSLNVELDDKPIPRLFDRRYRSTAFSLTVPSDNVFNAGCEGLPRGIYSPAIDEGYYVMLKPLPVGKHVLRIRSDASGFGVDVTYNLTIVPVVLR
jgi:hypothetical protein